MLETGESGFRFVGIFHTPERAGQQRRATKVSTTCDSGGAPSAGQISVGARGIDLELISPQPPSLADREALAAFAEAHDLARISWAADAGFEPMVQRRASSVAAPVAIARLQFAEAS